MFQNYKMNLLSLLSGFLIGSLIKIWPFRKALETRINSDGMEEVITSQPIIPNMEYQEELIFFVLFTLIGYFLISVFQKKSIS